MYVGIYPEKISEITGQSNNLSNVSISQTLSQYPSRIEEVQTTVCSSLPKRISKEKDWSMKFTNEQKTFLDYLLNIRPEVGDPIEKRHATWWIKSFGIEKIKIALQVYWKRVEKAKQDSSIPMPQHIGKYIRKALNDGILPSQYSDSSEKKQKPAVSSPYLEKSEQVVEKFEIGPEKNETTNTQTSMTSLSINEVNDKRESVTFQKAKEQKGIHKTKSTEEAIKSPSHNPQNSKKDFKRYNQEPDWKEAFSSEEKKFLSYLLRLQPERGDPIKEKHASWWIKNYGVEKIKIALQVYWQQVEKAKRDSKVPMPLSMGAYVREALNKGTQPCRENDKRNKAFAEQFKRQVGWSELTITEKYCRAEDFGKEWLYSLPEPLFVESLKNTFENYCSYIERQSYVA